MAAIDVKLNHALRLVSKLEALTSRSDRVAFADEFSSLLSVVGAIRQYIQNDLSAALKSSPQAQTWIDALETNLDVATMIGLRNTDVHGKAIQVTFQHVFLTANSEVANLSFSAHTTVTHADGSVSSETFTHSEPAPSFAPDPPSARVEYHLSSAVLPPSFMTAHRAFPKFGRLPEQSVSLAAGESFPMKKAVQQNLDSSDLGSIAARAVDCLCIAIVDGRQHDIIFSPPYDENVFEVNRHRFRHLDQK